MRHGRHPGEEAPRVPGEPTLTLRPLLTDATPTSVVTEVRHTARAAHRRQLASLVVGVAGHTRGARLQHQTTVRVMGQVRDASRTAQPHQLPRSVVVVVGP